MWRATVNGARRLTRGASARALRRTPANNMARRIGMGGRLEQRLCSLPVLSRPFRAAHAALLAPAAEAVLSSRAIDRNGARA